jgi:hypothetical protein
MFFLLFGIWLWDYTLHLKTCCLPTAWPSSPSTNKKVKFSFTLQHLLPQVHNLLFLFPLALWAMPVPSIVVWMCSLVVRCAGIQVVEAGRLLRRPRADMADFLHAQGLCCRYCRVKFLWYQKYSSFSCWNHTSTYFHDCATRIFIPIECFAYSGIHF